MQVTSNELLKTVAPDHLKLFNKEEPIYERVNETLSFKRQDVATAAKVSLTNVRYDGRVPDVLRQRYIEWANALNTIADYFKGEPEKAIIWFKVPNPMLGGMTPRDMIRVGRYKKLMSFINSAIEENKR